MATFVSQSQIKTILKRIHDWLAANMAPKSTAVTNVSFDSSAKQLKKTVNGTTTKIMDIDLDSKANYSGSTSQDFSTKDLSVNGDAVVTGNVNAESYSLTKSNKVVTVDSDATANYTIKFPNKTSGSPFTFATTADIPAVDANPTANSTNAVSSGGVYTALGNKADLSNSSQDIVTGTLAADSNITAEGYIGASSFSLSKNNKVVTVDSDASADYTIKFPNKASSGSPYTIATTADIPASITIDSAPTSGSNHAVSSGGVYTALSGKADLNNSEQDFAANDITASTVTASNSVTASTINATNEVVIGGTTLYDNGGTLSIGLPSRPGTIALVEDIALEPAYVIATRDASTGLPDVTNPKHGVIYLVLATNGTNNAYDEYLWVNTTGSTNVWEKIGSTEISLSGFWNKNASSADYLAEAALGNTTDTVQTSDTIYAYLNEYFNISAS